MRQQSFRQARIAQKAAQPLEIPLSGERKGSTDIADSEVRAGAPKPRDCFDRLALSAKFRVTRREKSKRIGVFRHLDGGPLRIGERLFISAGDEERPGTVHEVQAGIKRIEAHRRVDLFQRLLASSHVGACRSNDHAKMGVRRIQPDGQPDFVQAAFEIAIAISPPQGEAENAMAPRFVRVSFDREHTDADIDHAADAIRAAVVRLRALEE